MEVVWSEMALHQLDEILDNVQENYGEMTASRIYEKIVCKVSSLLKSPQRGIPDLSYSSKFANGDVLIRHLLVYPSVIYYNVDDETINIMLIAHTKQSPQTISSMIMRYYENSGV